jgi:2,3-bisphosphoglycerate-independent phosphoglycerate mutase
MKKPTLLCILDGWGESAEREHNAIAQAATPNFDAMRAAYPFGTLSASELDVGLPTGQMGNSEVGHMNIGAGRVVMQELPRIDAAIADGSLAKNAALLHYIAALKKSGGTCHLMGLLSDGGVHSHMNHMAALANAVAAAGVPVAVHAFLDGRDVAPKSAEKYVAQFVQQLGRFGNNSFFDILLRYVGAVPKIFLPCPTFKRRYTSPKDGFLKCIKFAVINRLWGFYEAAKPHSLINMATAMGRYHAMDRDKRWDRIEQAYNTLVEGGGDWTDCAENVVGFAYDIKNVSDEFIPPSVVNEFEGMNDGDGILMANFRADRARQLLHALIDPNFAEFKRERTVRFAATLGMVEYSEALNPLIPAMFPAQKLHHNLGELVANAGMTQLRIAETEKYAHVTFFFNGGREAPFAGEDRILVPSPKVATYDLQPEMSAPEVTDKLVEAIGSGKYDLIVVNYANTDMVGHSGDLAAAMKAVEAVDTCLGRLKNAIDAAGGAMLITADHGNAECLHDDDSGQAHTAHTLNFVPCMIVGEAYKNAPKDLGHGILADIAPTLCAMLNLTPPPEMTGRSLLPEPR